MEYQFEHARPADLTAVLRWITTAEDLRLWGGSALTFPPEADRTWQEIGADDTNTYAMLDPRGEVLGFGQTLLRGPAVVHLGRIIISPAARGRGLGRVLCERLIRAGTETFHPSMFTLNVYRFNTPAVSLYRALGFVVLSENEEQDSFTMGLPQERIPG